MIQKLAKKEFISTDIRKRDNMTILNEEERQIQKYPISNKIKVTMTKEIALTQPRTIYLYNQYNADKTPMRCRSNGKCRTWKTRPNDFRLPVKRGIYEYGYIDQSNMNKFYIEV